MTAALAAQTNAALTRISVSGKDATFFVDGQAFAGSAAFTWPAGSKHTLEVPLMQPGGNLKTRYAFQDWNSAAGKLPIASSSVTITADPAISWYNADLSTQYAISLVFFQCAQIPCASPGSIVVNQSAYQADADVWVPAGTALALLATPNPGFVFCGWGQGPSTPLWSFTLNQPMMVYPTFAPARSIQLVTSPDGLQLRADRAPVTSPATLEWGWNTTHMLGAPSPQWDQTGHLWLFRSWSDGGAANHVYQVAGATSAATVTAQFGRAVAVQLDSNPSGLGLTVDGSYGTAPRKLFWAPGDSHAVAAPTKQTDAAGGPWVFRAWSNGGPNPEQVTVTDSQVDTGIRMTALYDPLSRIRVDSAPSGLVMTVDGSECRTPCELERAVGSTVRVAAPASVAVGDGIRLDLAGWDGADGGTVTAAAGYQRVTARYRTAYQLILRADPAGAGTWRLSPASSDGFYAAGTGVSVAVDPASGMRFRGWGLDLSGSANPAAIAIDGPHEVEAIFERLPDTPPPPRVVNAAGETPTNAVAAGSIATLFGTGLADGPAQGTTDPLPQSLGGVTLRCTGRLLPLLYVSPQQINFEVPGDLTPGQYRLEVLRGNAPASQADFNLVRNAPGIFVAAHLDGTAITAQSPARTGEDIILYATGLGPFVPKPLDGFRVPAAPTFVVEDAVDVLLGGRVLSPDSEAAVAGSVGLAAIQFHIPDDLDISAGLGIAIRAGGVVSNTLPLSFQ